MLNVKIKKLNERAKTPTYATDGSGCFDLYYAGLESVDLKGAIGNGCKSIFGTGLKFEITKDYVMMIFSRSGHGFKDDVRLSNCVGIIDEDFRGEVMVKLARESWHGCAAFYVNPGDRIAQAIIIERRKVEFIEVDELSETARGEGGFGHTGA